MYVLRPLDKKTLLHLLHEAIKKDEVLKNYKIELRETEALINISGGDARKLYNLLELAASSNPSEGGISPTHKTRTQDLEINKEMQQEAFSNRKVSPFGGDSEGALEGDSPIIITDDLVMKVAQQRTVLYDKKGERHYDIISAFIKSMRGSDPNAAVYWLARMIEGGEDVKFIARRMIILASEDIGNANPNALLLATNTFQAVNVIGYPEARIILSQCAIYLATSPKSNASYMAIEEALSSVKKYGDLPVPLQIRNAPTKLMKNLNYGRDYKYAHSYEANFILQEFLPDEIQNTTFYEPGKNSREEELRKFLRDRWKEKYGY